MNLESMKTHAAIHADTTPDSPISKMARDVLRFAALVRSIRDLHTEMAGVCTHCWNQHEDIPEPWPCLTVQLIDNNQT